MRYKGVARTVDRTDHQLIAACQAGEQSAWNEMIDRYGRLVYSIPRRYGLSEADADDVFAAVWAIVFRSLARLRDEAKLSSWLITTTHRESWRVGKNRGGAVAIELDRHVADVSSPSDDQISTWEQQHLVRQGLAELGGKCEELLKALFMEPGEPKYDAIAGRLGMSVGSIGPTRARCFKKLETILRRLGLDHSANSSEIGS
jgi:RNA polymerase sigma factor (sigma-70 family)